jgi:hypothetical protein
MTDKPKDNSPKQPVNTPTPKKQLSESTQQPPKVIKNSTGQDAKLGEKEGGGTTKGSA